LNQYELKNKIKEKKFRSIGKFDQLFKIKYEGDLKTHFQERSRHKKNKDPKRGIAFGPLMQAKRVKHLIGTIKLITILNICK
jgi:hypothetical protein